jgi:phage-related minor tail protein
MSDDVSESLIEGLEDEPIVSDQDEGEETSLQATPTVSEVVEEAKKEPAPKVDLGALHEERARRKEEQQRRAESEKKSHEQEVQIARMEERFKQFQEKVQAPDYDENPAEFLKHENVTLKDRLETLEGKQTQSEQTTKEQQNYQSFYQNVTAEEAAYTQAQPDYYQAVAHLRTSRLEELQMAGYEIGAATQIVDQEAHMIAQQSISSGKNSAETFYKMAKARGYQKGTNKVEQLEEVKKGAERTQSLGASGETAGNLSLAALAEMEDDDFAKATEGDNWRKLMTQ